MAKQLDDTSKGYLQEIIDNGHLKAYEHFQKLPESRVLKLLMRICRLCLDMTDFEMHSYSNEPAELLFGSWIQAVRNYQDGTYNDAQIFANVYMAALDPNLAVPRAWQEKIDLILSPSGIASNEHPSAFTRCLNYINQLYHSIGLNENPKIPICVCPLSADAERTTKDENISCGASKSSSTVSESASSVSESSSSGSEKSSSGSESSSSGSEKSSSSSASGSESEGASESESQETGSKAAIATSKCTLCTPKSCPKIQLNSSCSFMVVGGPGTNKDFLWSKLKGFHSSYFITTQSELSNLTYEDLSSKKMVCLFEAQLMDFSRAFPLLNYKNMIVVFGTKDVFTKVPSFVLNRCQTNCFELDNISAESLVMNYYAKVKSYFCGPVAFDEAGSSQLKKKFNKMRISPKYTNIYDAEKRATITVLNYMQNLNHLPLNEPVYIRYEHMHGGRVELEKTEDFKTIDNLIGLERVKDNVKKIVDSLSAQKYNSIKKLIIGPLGSGKTTVATCLGNIVVKSDLVDGQPIIKNASSLIGSMMGESESLVKAFLDKGVQNVLIIENMDSLFGDDFSQDNLRVAALNALASGITEEMNIFMTGSSDIIQKMTTKIPSMMRWFPVSDRILFDDYTNEQLIAIFNRYCGDKVVSLEQQPLVLEMINRKKHLPGYGNSDTVKKMAEMALMNLFLRKGSELSLEDIDPDSAINRKFDIDELLSDLIGLGPVLDKLSGYQKTIALCKKMGKDPTAKIPMCLRFVGPPGTGKTTVARRIGTLYHALGILGSDKVHDCSASDLIAPYVGQSALKTRRKMDEARGGVLFIDEAYRLKNSNYGQECMDEITDLLTKTNYFRKMVVIIAGYDTEIAQLMASNPGLSSRFNETIMFEPFSLEKSINILCCKIAEEGFEVDKEELLKIKPLLTSKNWGNGRDLITLRDRLIREFSLLEDCEEFKIPAEIITKVVNEFTLERGVSESSIHSKIQIPLAFDEVAAPCDGTLINTNVKIGIDSDDEDESEEADDEKNDFDILNDLGVCVQGFKWILKGDRYVCAGGSHQISLATVKSAKRIKMNLN